MSNRIQIFDTTLRDGEQAPGATLNEREKLEIANQLVTLGVDVIEAGFPISSAGDFNAVKRIASSVKGVIVCGLARSITKDIDAAYEATKAQAIAEKSASVAKLEALGLTVDDLKVLGS